jgi:hypothetical protein
MDAMKIRGTFGEFFTVCPHLNLKESSSLLKE